MLVLLNKISRFHLWNAGGPERQQVDNLRDLGSAGFFVFKNC